MSRHVGLLRASSFFNRNRLTRQGRAAVPAPPPPPASPLLGKSVLPFAVSRAPSCPDQILEARAEGAFDGVVPRQLKKVTRRIAKRLSLPFLAAVVRQAMEKSFRARLKCLGCLRWPIAWFERQAAQLALGPDREVGVRALRSLFNGGGLNRGELAARVAGITDQGREHRAVLLAMGCDPAVGFLHYDRRHHRMVADLNLAKLAPAYAQQERLMTGVAHQLGGELRNNPAWEYLHKPVTVHNQGGCRMSDDPDGGVTDAFGKVHHCEGLYILDGSVLCKPSG